MLFDVRELSYHGGWSVAGGFFRRLLKWFLQPLAYHLAFDNNGKI